MRQKIVAGNWKMNQTIDTAGTLLNEIVALHAQLEHSSKVTTVICPPYLVIPSCAQLLSGKDGIFCGAQNCHNEDKGAYTGEISAEMIATAGSQYVILGHSERRMYFKEDAIFLKKKVQACLSHNLIPIFCCGEIQAERESGKHQEVVEAQIREALFSFTADEMLMLVIAYEPVWAIGTGLTASPAQAQEMHHFIRSILQKQYGSAVAEAIPILYGGSCNAANAEELFSQADVDGGLIGGASLKSADFIAIISAAIKTSNL